MPGNSDNAMPNPSLRQQRKPAVPRRLVSPDSSSFIMLPTSRVPITPQNPSRRTRSLNSLRPRQMMHSRTGSPQESTPQIQAVHSNMANTKPPLPTEVQPAHSIRGSANPPSTSQIRPAYSNSANTKPPLPTDVQQVHPIMGSANPPSTSQIRPAYSNSANTKPPLPTEVQPAHSTTGSANPPNTSQIRPAYSNSANTKPPLPTEVQPAHSIKGSANPPNTSQIRPAYSNSANTKPPLPTEVQPAHSIKGSANPPSTSQIRPAYSNSANTKPPLPTEVQQVHPIMGSANPPSTSQIRPAYSNSANTKPPLPTDVQQVHPIMGSANPPSTSQIRPAYSNSANTKPPLPTEVQPAHSIRGSANPPSTSQIRPAYSNSANTKPPLPTEVQPAHSIKGSANPPSTSQIRPAYSNSANIQQPIATQIQTTHSRDVSTHQAMMSQIKQSHLITMNSQESIASQTLAMHPRTVSGQQPHSLRTQGVHSRRPSSKKKEMVSRTARVRQPIPTQTQGQGPLLSQPPPMRSRSATTQAPLPSQTQPMRSRNAIAAENYLSQIQAMHSRAASSHDHFYSQMQSMLSSSPNSRQTSPQRQSSRSSRVLLSTSPQRESGRSRSPTFQPSITLDSRASQNLTAIHRSIPLHFQQSDLEKDRDMALRSIHTKLSQLHGEVRDLSPYWSNLGSNEQPQDFHTGRRETPRSTSITRERTPQEFNNNNNEPPLEILYDDLNPSPYQLGTNFPDMSGSPMPRAREELYQNQRSGNADRRSSRHTSSKPDLRNVQAMLNFTMEKPEDSPYHSDMINMRSRDNNLPEISPSRPPPPYGTRVYDDRAYYTRRSGMPGMRPESAIEIDPYDYIDEPPARFYSYSGVRRSGSNRGDVPHTITNDDMSSGAQSRAYQDHNDGMININRADMPSTSRSSIPYKGPDIPHRGFRFDIPNPFIHAYLHDITKKRPNSAQPNNEQDFRPINRPDMPNVMNEPDVQIPPVSTTPQSTNTPWMESADLLQFGGIHRGDSDIEGRQMLPPLNMTMDRPNNDFSGHRGEMPNLFMAEDSDNEGHHPLNIGMVQGNNQFVGYRTGLRTNPAPEATITSNSLTQTSTLPPLVSPESSVPRHSGSPQPQVDVEGLDTVADHHNEMAAEKAGNAPQSGQTTITGVSMAAANQT